MRKVPEYSDPATLAQAKARAEAAWRVLDAHLEGRRYILGDALTMADIPVGALVYRWLPLPLERPHLPHLASWYRRLCERPAYRTHVILPLR